MPTTATRPRYWESTQQRVPAVGSRSTSAPPPPSTRSCCKLPDRLGLPHARPCRCRAAPTASTFSTIVASTGYTFDPAARTRSPSTSPDVDPVRPAQRHRQHGLAGRPALRVRRSTAPTTTSSNLAAGKPGHAETSHTQTYASGNADDGNQATYWESSNNAFPQWIQVDLGSSVADQQGRPEAAVRLGHPHRDARRCRAAPTARASPTSSPPRRTRSTRPANTVTITFSSATTRYVRLNITANTGWPAGADLRVRGVRPDPGDTQARPRRPTSPTPSRSRARSS